MKSALVGYTGFVGSNLRNSHQFTHLYNSKNIQEAFGTEPDLLVFAGLPSAMFKANVNPRGDYINIIHAIENIKAIKPKQIVLISTIAVYDKIYNVDENYIINDTLLLPYGKNRLFLEKWVSENFSEKLIVRLPALYGINLKKNFIYDFINIIPAMLNEKKYKELSEKSELVERAYKLGNDDLYHLIVAEDKKKKIYEYFSSTDFNAIRFTDSRSIYQFYNLSRLWRDIQIALDNNIELLNIVTEPISIAEIYKYLTGSDFKNELSKQPFNYDIKSIHADLFGGEYGYMIGKDMELTDLKKYVFEEKQRIWG